ncbi:MAG TPA: hypothetical protein H9861_00080 [Candidatus Ligilactobacillus excrementigallinarum]|uniref:Gram-positive cocci surface proteins LPxTG domain-containing protein n=1 Tax=Candidatus Ligilactobacillus excrementigallinarum TaxID=2838641 RepID=A0A9D1UVH7_9LACO|nr:hypothetical protein [Candidatus Ligilactobacillus excrementigallinarum]
MKKISKLFLGFAALVFLIFQSQGVISAKQITVNGLNASDAKIYDGNGQEVEPGSVAGTQYDIKYNWSIPDNENVSAGDTATVTLPKGFVASSTVTGNIKLSNGTVVGTITIQKGSNQGTITFNNQLYNTYGKHGELTISATKKSNSSGDSSGAAPTWMINKAGWLDQGAMQDGAPTKIYWDVVVNPAGKNLKNVVVTDTIGEGQEYIDGSAQFYNVKYSSTGESKRINALNNVKVTTKGNQVTFDLGDITEPVEIEYETSITSLNPDSANIWQNTARIDATGITGKDKDYATVSWGAGGTAQEYQGKINITKVDYSNPSTALPGAVFELRDANGVIVRSDVVTGKDGKITIDNLPDGTYQLIETQAPAGYKKDSKPIEVTLDKNDKHDVNQTIVNKPIVSSSSSSSSLIKSSSSSSVKSLSSSKSSLSLVSSSSSSQSSLSLASSSKNNNSSLASSSSSVIIPSSSQSSSSSSVVVPILSSSTTTTSIKPESSSANLSNNTCSTSESVNVVSSSLNVVPAFSKSSSISSETVVPAAPVPASQFSESSSAQQFSTESQVQRSKKQNSKEIIQSSKKENHGNELPQTGSDNVIKGILTFAGLTFIIIAGILLLKRKSN